MKKLLFILLIALIGGVGGWWIGSRTSQGGSSHASHASHAAEKKPLFYQSPMHPWIKSDTPGQCTICGMDLAPVYDASGAGGADSKDVVMLPAGSPKIAGIATLPARRQPLVRTLRFSGKIVDDPTRRRVVSANVRGRIDQLHVNFVGAEVAQGAPLADFFSRQLLIALSEYRYSTGNLRKGATFKLTQLGLTAAQIADLNEDDPLNLTFPLLSPITGTVTAQHVKEGQWVDEGEALFEVADLSKMWFLFDAYEHDLPWLKPGQTVEVQTPSHPGKRFEAAIAFIEPGLDPVSRTVRVRVELDNPFLEAEKTRLFHNQLFAQAEVAVPIPDTLTIPRSAMIWPGGEPRVFVEKEDGAYRLTPIQAGRTGDRMVEVLSGLKEGDKVVVRGGVLLDGQAQINHPLEAVAAALDDDTCPVSEEKLGSMGTPFVISHNEHEVPLCCKACREDFESDPVRYLKKLSRFQEMKEL